MGSSSIDTTKLHLGWDIGASDYTSYVLRRGPEVLGMWDHKPTNAEIEAAIIEGVGK